VIRAIREFGCAIGQSSCEALHITPKDCDLEHCGRLPTVQPLQNNPNVSSAVVATCPDLNGLNGGRSRLLAQNLSHFLPRQASDRAPVRVIRDRCHSSRSDPADAAKAFSPVASYVPGPSEINAIPRFDRRRGPGGRLTPKHCDQLACYATGLVSSREASGEASPQRPGNSDRHAFGTQYNI
jgi:hypothetical protein